MPDVHGTIKSSGTGRFIATFLINDIYYTYAATYSGGAVEFSSHDAKLSYKSTDQMKTMQEFEGKIGTDNFSLKIKNGPLIDGKLEKSVDPACNVRGMGQWMMQ